MVKRIKKTSYLLCILQEQNVNILTFLLIRLRSILIMLNTKYFRSYGKLEAIYDEGWEIWAVTVNEGILDRDRNFVLKQATFQFSKEFFQGLLTNIKHDTLSKRGI